MKLSTLIVAGALGVAALAHAPASPAAEAGSGALDPALVAAVSAEYANGVARPRQVRRVVVRRHVRVRRSVRYARPPGCDCRRKVYYYPHEYPNEELENLPTHHEVPAPYFRRYTKLRAIRHHRRPAAARVMVKG